MTNSKIYYDQDASLENIQNKTVGIIGYGNQGRAQAMNMRDSGVGPIIIGSVEDQSLELARDDDFPTGTIADVSQESDIIFLLIPDEVMPQVYLDEVLGGLTEGKVLNFASGYNITFNKIVPPGNIDIIMVAPRMVGSGVRDLYLNGQGYPSFVGVAQDYSGQARSLALGLAKAMGATRKGAIEVTFQQETTMDLFAEQATWPLIEKVLLSAFEFQIAKGLPAEAVISELYLSKEPAYMFEKMADMGFFKQMVLHSRTSQYGQLSRFEQVDDTAIRSFMEKAFKEIGEGSFAAEWEQEQVQGFPKFDRLKAQALAHPLNTIEEKLRAGKKHHASG